LVDKALPPLTATVNQQGRCLCNLHMLRARTNSLGMYSCRVEMLIKDVNNTC